MYREGEGNLALGNLGRSSSVSASFLGVSVVGSAGGRYLVEVISMMCVWVSL